jgi:glucokinase
LFVGVDLGGTKTLAAVGTAEGKILASVTNSSEADKPAEIIVDVMARTARQAVAKAKVDESAIRGVGIAAAGAINTDEGVVVWCPQLKQISNHPVVSMFQRRWKVPTFIGNDANLAALAEHHYGVGRGVRNLLFITVSTGIGGGLVLDGKLYTGRLGYAGEIGHMTVDAHGPYGRSTTPGAWESLCSGTALARIAGERMDAGEQSSLASIDRKELSALDVFAAVRAGDALSKSVIANAIEYLGAGLTSVVNAFDPDIVVIGGGLSNEWDSYIAPGIAIMRRQAYAGMGKDLKVVPPKFGAEAGALGGIALAADRTMLSSPLT